jgi:hypothetical protein
MVHITRPNVLQVKSVADNSQYDGASVGISSKVSLKSIIVIDDYSYAPVS